MAEPKLYTQNDLDKKAKSEVKKLNKMEIELSKVQQELSSNPQFLQFLDAQKKLQEQTDNFWSEMKKRMIASSIKNIKGDWGWITLGETLSYSVDDISKVPEEFTYEDVNVEALREDIGSLDSKYKVTVADLAAIKQDVSLTDEVPNGINQKVSYKLMKKINPVKDVKVNG